MSAISESPIEPNDLWVGTSDQRVWRAKRNKNSEWKWKELTETCLGQRQQATSFIIETISLPDFADGALSNSEPSAFRQRGRGDPLSSPFPATQNTGIVQSIGNYSTRRKFR